MREASPSIEAFVSTKTSVNTQEAYRYDLVSLERHIKRELHPDLVTDEIVGPYLGQYSNRTARRHLAVINQYLIFHGRPRLTVKAPSFVVPPPVMLSREEVNNLIAASRGETKAMLLLVYSGLTVSEMLHGKLVADADAITVTGRRGKVRTVPLRAEVAAYVRKFPPPYDLTRNGFLRRFTKLAPPGATIDSMRHSFALHMAEAGAPAEVLTQIMDKHVHYTKPYFHAARDKASKLWKARATLLRTSPPKPS